MGLIIDFLTYVGLAAQFVVVVLLLRSRASLYPLLFFYCIFQLVTSALESWVISSYGNPSEAYRRIFWTAEFGTDLLRFLLVAGMTDRVLVDSPLRQSMRRVLTVIAVAAAGLPLLVYYQREIFSNQWFGGIGQFLNFGLALSTVVLWTALLSTRSRDRQLLSLSAGLGIAVTGAAIAFGLYFLNRNVASLLNWLAIDAGLLVWCWALWKQPESEPVTSSASNPAS